MGMHYDEHKKEFSYDEDVLALFEKKEKEEDLPSDCTPIDFGETSEKSEKNENKVDVMAYLDKIGYMNQVEEAKKQNPVKAESKAEEKAVSQTMSETVVFTAPEKPVKSEKEAELGSGLGEAVIDRDEWDKILAQIDAQNQEKKEQEQQEQEKKGLENSKKEMGISKKETENKKPSSKTNSSKKTSKKSKKKKKGHFLRNLILTVLVLGVLCCCAVGYIVVGIIKETPEINPDNIYDMLSENSILLDSNGVLIDNIYEGGTLRTNVEYQDMPEDLIWALVCTEDKTFFTHNGFNIVRIFGAVWDTVKSFGSVRIGGTSTITQQLARNIYLTDTMSSRGWEGIKRKIQEAYYTVILEKTLTKEQIIEAYLNTIYLGFNSDGVQAAAQAYFSKDVSDLDLIECAMLATLPQSPNTYAPLKRVLVSDYTTEELEEIDIVTMNDTYVIRYNDAIESRVGLVLRNMLAQGHLSQEEYDSIDIHEAVRSRLNPGSTLESAEMDSTYFKDYIIEEVLEDLQEELGYTEQEAYDALYTGGLIINSTLDLEVQNIVEEVWSDVDNFPNIKLENLDVDANNNICYPETRNIMLYEKSNIIDENGNFTLKASEYEKLSNGDIKIYKGNRLGIYKTQVGSDIEIAIEFKNMYYIENEELYSVSGGYWNIDTQYKERDENGNGIIKSAIFDDEKYEDCFTFNSDGTLTISSDFFVLRDPVIQPQSAMVIIENETGAIRAMIGGRNITGKRLYNRAINPRQTGSSIKPLAVYSLALQKGRDNALSNAVYHAQNPDDESYEDLPVYTAATPLDDIPMNIGGKLWPYEFDNKFRGATYLRSAVQQSLNCCSVSLFLDALSPWESVTNLQNMGVSTLVTTGDANDLNAASLALGGFTQGISPLEMCAAYATFGNYGTYNEPKCYTTITNKKGDVLLSSEKEGVAVYTEDVASLVLDILHSVVYGGGASGAKLTSQVSGGKTGTTSDNYDLWFCGLTPKYSATVWIGSDTNLYINGTSSGNATKLFRLVMEKVGALDEKVEEFEKKGEFTTCLIDSRSGLLANEFTPEEYVREEIFISGTEEIEGLDEPVSFTTAPTEYSSVEVTLRVCSHTGYLATPECEMYGCAVTRTYTTRPGGISWETLLSTYTIHEDSEILFDENGKQYISQQDRDAEGNLIFDEEGNPVMITYWYDKETNTYKDYEGTEADISYLVDDKSVYLDIVPDAESDPPEFYCPLHNSNTEEYPISPFADKKDYTQYYENPWWWIQDQTTTEDGEETSGEEQTENQDEVQLEPVA